MERVRCNYETFAKALKQIQEWQMKALMEEQFEMCDIWCQKSSLSGWTITVACARVDYDQSDRKYPFVSQETYSEEKMNEVYNTIFAR